MDSICGDLNLQYALYDIISLMIDFIFKTNQFNLMQLLVDFCYTTQCLGPAYFVSSVAYQSLQRTRPALSSNDMVHFQRLCLSFKNVTERLSICWLFSEHLDPNFLKGLQLTARSFGETEKVCISRLIAIHRIQSFKEITERAPSPLDFEKV